MIPRKIIREAVGRIVERFHPERIILFGSQARETADERSDIDLLVIYPLSGNRLELMVEIYRTLAHVDRAFDIVVLSPDEYEIDREIPGTLARYVSREGRVIYDAAKERRRKKGKRVAGVC